MNGLLRSRKFWIACFGVLQAVVLHYFNVPDDIWQAIAALAYGTQTIRRVQKIFGPGNAYVVTAKRLVVGHVGIDLLPGPSELLVLADEKKVHEQNLAALHDKLKLTAQQETAWKKFAAIKPIADPALRPDPAEMDKLNAPQRLEKGLAHMRAMEAKLTEHLAALKEFYAEFADLFDRALPLRHRLAGLRRYGLVGSLRILRHTPRVMWAIRHAYRDHEENPQPQGAF